MTKYRGDLSELWVQPKQSCFGVGWLGREFNQLRFECGNSPRCLCSNPTFDWERMAPFECWWRLILRRTWHDYWKRKFLRFKFHLRLRVRNSLSTNLSNEILFCHSVSNFICKHSETLWNSDESWGERRCRGCWLIKSENDFKAASEHGEASERWCLINFTQDASWG